MGMPDETVDATGLNADLEAQVRAIAEMAVSRLAQMRARPDTALDPGDEPSIDAPAAEAASSVEGVAEPQMWFIGPPWSTTDLSRRRSTRRQAVSTDSTTAISSTAAGQS